jgi:hypothetical protein
MRTVEFAALVQANANKTSRIRVYSGPWYTAVSRMPNKVTTQIGRVVHLIQAKMDEGHFCKPDEGLLVYGYQALSFDTKQLYASLQTVIKPRVDLNNTKNNTGTPLQIIINSNTGDVMNNSQGMLALGLCTTKELQETHAEVPITYGNYNDYLALCCAIAIASYHPIKNVNEIFMGKWDQSDAIRNATAFDSFAEARDYLSECQAVTKLIGEAIFPKEKLSEGVQKGIGKNLIKLIDPVHIQVQFTPIKEVLQQEDMANDESERLMEAMQETEEIQKHTMQLSL